MIEISIRRILQFERTEADIVKGLIVDAEGLVGVLNELVHGERGIVRFHNCIRHLNMKYSEFRNVDWKARRYKLSIKTIALISGIKREII